MMEPSYGVDVNDLSDKYPRFTLAEISERYGVPRATLTLHIRRGTLRATLQANRYTVRGGDLAAWMENCWKPRQRQEKEK